MLSEHATQSRNIPAGERERAISEIPGDLGEIKVGSAKGTTSGMAMKPRRTRARASTPRGVFAAGPPCLDRPRDYTLEKKRERK